MSLVPPIHFALLDAGRSADNLLCGDDRAGLE
jgi:hypothetical protein